MSEHAPAAAPQRSRPTRRWRHPLAIVLCLSVGLIFSSAATGLAVSGLSSDGSAACVQYPQRCDDKPASRVPVRGADKPASRVPVRGADLPFTGSAALVILGLGGVLLAMGAVLRPRTRNSADE